VYRVISFSLVRRYHASSEKFVTPVTLMRLLVTAAAPARAEIRLLFRSNPIEKGFQVGVNRVPQVRYRLGELREGGDKVRREYQESGRFAAPAKKSAVPARRRSPTLSRPTQRWPPSARRRDKWTAGSTRTGDSTPRCPPWHRVRVPSFCCCFPLLGLVDWL